MARRKKKTAAQSEQERKDEAIRLLVQSFQSKDRSLIHRVEDAGSSYMLRRPTGVMELDIDLGGGFPAGGCSMISGPDNSGKTYLLLKTLAMQQRIYGEAARLAFGVAEGSFPYGQALDAGLRIAIPDDILDQWQEWRRLRGIPQFTKAELLNYKKTVGAVYVYGGATGEEILQVTLDMCRSNAFQIVGMDSLNGLQPQADAGKDLDENKKMAARAVLIQTFFEHYIPTTTGIFGTNETTLLFTQQVRSNSRKAEAPSYMQKYIKDWAPSGGYAAKHFKLIDLVVDSGGKLKNSKKEVIGKEMRWELIKGKAGTHDNKTGSTSFYYPLGVDIAGELIVSGIKRGLIAKHGKEILVTRPDTGEVVESLTVGSEKEMREKIETDVDYEMTLRREVLAQAGVQCLYQ